ncbi:DPP IV N-terminal domain-containing protein [Candidatus Bipolaricaulota bacterium]
MKCLLAAAVLVICAVSVVAAQIDIPLGSSPAIDGAFTASEWLDAMTVEFTANAGTIHVRVHLVHDAEQLYVAFEYLEYPDGELVIPEILIDPNNGKSEMWASDDWWVHVSAQNCDAQGEYDNYDRCGLTRPLWRGRPNFASGDDSVPLDAIEIRIPLSMLEIPIGKVFGLGLTVNAWPSETRGYWPAAASIDSPATWGEAVLSAGPMGKIAFDSDRDGNDEIYVMNANGSNQTRLTEHSARDTGAVWSPDGTKVLFYSSRSGAGDLYIMNADGADVRRITQTRYPDGHPSWSPDGSRIVFVSFPSGESEICVMNVDGTGFQQLTHNSNGDFEPVWLPDGESIGFSSQFTGFADIHVMDVDGENLARLTDTEAHDAYPHWSPDGSRITFCSNRDGNWEIYVMDADGENAKQLTYTESVLNGCPRWSPDGTEIVFESDREGDSEIYVMDADGGNVRQLTDNDANDRRPNWRP